MGDTQYRFVLDTERQRHGHHLQSSLSLTVGPSSPLESSEAGFYWQRAIAKDTHATERTTLHPTPLFAALSTTG